MKYIGITIAFNITKLICNLEEIHGIIKNCKMSLLRL